MRFSRHSAAALLAACVATACATTAFAAPAADEQNAADVRGAPGAAAPGEPPAGAKEHGAGPRGDHGDHGERGPDDGPHHGFGPSRFGAPGLDMPPPPHMLFAGLHRLHLTEAQQDKLFAITHAAEPVQRNQEKAERHAHEALMSLEGSAQFDEAKASAAARDLGQAIAARELQRLRMEAQVLAVLTPEQREQLHKTRPPGPPERR